MRDGYWSQWSQQEIMSMQGIESSRDLDLEYLKDEMTDLYNDGNIDLSNEVETCDDMLTWRDFF